MLSSIPLRTRGCCFGLHWSGPPGFANARFAAAALVDDSLQLRPEKSREVEDEQREDFRISLLFDEREQITETDGAVGDVVQTKRVGEHAAQSV